ncbi:hypothetical protein [Methylobacterium sp. E-046]|uniref:hypothetical protein n=1 Tax=Methylobacterium sp. E-046 TaxID=2836576 RepID=UPI001FBAF63D|nr:hypothetical protein [Methylobacterium sp. E-046]MCJ2102966.1 hypothetical protein [Methylobacterium sp. E-046]
MSDDAQPLGAGDILSLATKLAERMLQARSTGRTFSVDELDVVVKAAELLLALSVPWPAVVAEIIDILVADSEAIGAALGNANAEVRPVIGN